MKKRILSSLLLIGLILFPLVAVAGCSGGSDKGNESKPAATNESTPEITLRLGHVVTPTHSSNVSAEKFRDLVAEKTNGKVKIEIYPGGQLGGERDLLEMVQNGSLDMGQLTASIHSGFRKSSWGFSFLG